MKEGDIRRNRKKKCKEGIERRNGNKEGEGKEGMKRKKGKKEWK